MAFVTILLAAWGSVPDDLKQYLPHRYVTAMAIGVLLLGIAGRLVVQQPAGK
jgi:hypothetical protein